MARSDELAAEKHSVDLWVDGDNRLAVWTVGVT